MSLLAPIERSVRSARRRLFAQLLLTRLPVAWSVALVAGLAWIIPLKPLLKWMETGRFRD